MNLKNNTGLDILLPIIWIHRMYFMTLKAHDKTFRLSKPVKFEKMFKKINLGLVNVPSDC